MSTTPSSNPASTLRWNSAWWSAPLLVVAAVVFTAADRAAEHTPCRALEIEVDQLDGMYFVDAPSLKSAVTDGFALLDQPLSSLPYANLHDAILAQPGVAACTIEPTLGGALRIQVRQQRPLARVWSPDSVLYLDDEGRWFPLSRRYTADVPVVHAERATTARAALPLLHRLDTDPFWDRFIDQIEVDRDGQVSFRPRIGDLVVQLGDPRNHRDRLDVQLRQLRTFYTALLDSGDLRQYRELDLRYEGQLVARK